MLREIRVDARQRHRMKGEIPRGVPRVFPLVRHREHVVVEHMEPLAVPDGDGRGRVERIDPVLAQPQVDVEEVVLLRPEQAAEGLTHDERHVGAGRLRRERLIELVCLVTPGVERLVEGGKRARRLPCTGETEAHRGSSNRHRPRGDSGRRPWCRPAAGLTASALSAHEPRVKGVFDVRAGVGRVEQPLGIRLVLGEEQRRCTVAVEPVVAQLRVRRRHDAGTRRSLLPPPDGAFSSLATSARYCGTTGWVSR